MMRGPSHRLRFAVGVAVGGAVGIWLAHGLVGEARRQVAAQGAQRKAVVDLEALASLVQAATGDDAARKVALEWSARTPSIALLRVAKGMQLIASTAAADKGDRAAPRRLLRDEKPLYDRGQRLANAFQGNRDEQSAARAEVEVEAVEGGRLSLAAPLLAGGAPVGTVEIETAPVPPLSSTGWMPFALALLGQLVVFAGLAFLIGDRRVPLAIAGVTCLAAALFLLGRSSSALLEADRRGIAAAVAERVREQVSLAAALAPGAAPAAFDVDEFQKPRGEISPTGAVDATQLSAAVEARLADLRRALFSAGGIAIALLLLAGFGAFNALGATLRKNRQAYLYIAPAIIGMLALVFYPFSYGITLSFTDSNIYNTSKPISDIWVGLRNYREILGQFAFARRTENGIVFNYLNFYWTLFFTIAWTVCNVVVGVSSGLFLALILNTRALALRPVYRVLLILPWAMPNYITALIWKGMFHQQFGVINQMLQMIGLAPVNWFDHPFTSFLAAWTTNAWLSFPFMMVVSLGALQSIPADLYEAARVDGASRWQQFRAITLPSLRPALVPAVILSVVWTFNMFNIIFLVTGGDPSGSTEILVTQAYKFAFERYRYGYAAAYSTVIFGILLVYGVIQNRVSKGTEA